MTKKIILIGSGNHAAVIAEKVFEDSSLELHGFIDKNNNLSKSLTDQGYKIIGDDSTLLKFKNVASFHLALGAELISNRDNIISMIKKYKLDTISLLHKSSYISKSAKIGTGSTLLVNTVVNSNTVLGNHCCINTGAIIEHDCQIGDNVFIQPRSVLAGNVKIGDNTVIGIGATVRENITIGKKCFIGGGSLVCSDIPDSSLAYGVPAKIIRNNYIHK